jgi:hypothetical protein
VGRWDTTASSFSRGHQKRQCHVERYPAAASFEWFHWGKDTVDETMAKYRSWQSVETFSGADKQARHQRPGVKNEKVEAPIESPGSQDEAVKKERKATPEAATRNRNGPRLVRDEKRMVVGFGRPEMGSSIGQEPPCEEQEVAERAQEEGEVLPAV